MNSSHYKKTSDIDRDAKKQSKYTLLKTLSSAVCLCRDVDGNLIIAKYAKSSDKTLLKEIAFTELLSTGTHILIPDVIESYTSSTTKNRSALNHSAQDVKQESGKLSTIDGVPKMNIKSLTINLDVIQKSDLSDPDTPLVHQTDARKNPRKRKSYDHGDTENVQISRPVIDAKPTSGLVKTDFVVEDEEMHAVDLSDNPLNGTRDSTGSQPPRKRNWSFKKFASKVFKKMCPCFSCTCLACFACSKASSYMETDSSEAIDHHHTEPCDGGGETIVPSTVPSTVPNTDSGVAPALTPCSKKSVHNKHVKIDRCVDDRMIVMADGSMKRVIKFKIIDPQFDHRQFCEYVNVTLSPQKSYLITNYSGVDLFELTVYKKNLTEQLAKTVIKKLVHALQNLHKLGIAHGDMSLENVCIDAIAPCNYGDRSYGQRDYGHETLQRDSSSETSFDSKEELDFRTTESFEEIKEILLRRIYSVDDFDTDLNVRLIDYGCSIVHPQSPYHSMIAAYETSSRVILCDMLIDHTEHDRINQNSFEPDHSYTTSFNTKLKPYDSKLNVYGKEQYISPERYTAHFDTEASYCSYKDDVYSIGVMIFTMVTGVFPYNLTSRSGAVSIQFLSDRWKQMYAVYIQNSHPLSSDILDLIDNIIKPESSRFTLDQILAHPWLM